MLAAFPVLIRWLHLAGVVIWIGGLAFQALVVMPALRRTIASVPEQVRLGLVVEARFRPLLWSAVGVVLFTGLYNVLLVLYVGALAGNPMPPRFSQVLGLKLLLVAGMLVVQTVQHFLVRPRRLALLRQVAAKGQVSSQEFLRIRRLNQRLSTLVLALAGAVIMCALLLRG